MIFSCKKRQIRTNTKNNKPNVNDQDKDQPKTILAYERKTKISFFPSLHAIMNQLAIDFCITMVNEINWLPGTHQIVCLRLVRNDFAFVAMSLAFVEFY